ncbi:MAG: radical SAM protein [Acidobacteriota bacterium]|nr:radical SAM protein [Acidobacteriota bacterium]
MLKSGRGVVLIGFEDQENLGLRGIAAHLQKHGIGAAVVPFNLPKTRILSEIRKAKPAIVGFSLIFQRFFFDFRDLIAYLRDKGISAHFTMGGHFPSMDYRETLENIPGLDSVVRFEGEETLVELCRKIAEPDEWAAIRGLAFRRNGRLEVNPPRPLIADLDSLPLPLRDKKMASHRGLGVRSILASRGCYHNCSFCSIHQFYREPPGPLRRTRSPSHVVREMEALFHDCHARVFIFQDDDWFMKGRAHAAWIEDFIGALERSSIREQVAWRISCRIDDLRADLLGKMKDAGLLCVYLGIESGNDRGLQVFNKHFTVDDVHRAIELLRHVGMPFEFGFMIFDPESTFKTVLENIRFLERITEDGRTIAGFSKMVPYAGTAIAAKLKEEGRLKGTIASPDYGFRDPRLDALQLIASRTFNYRNFDREGLVERLRLAKFDVLILRKFFPNRQDAEVYGAEVGNLIRRSNAAALECFSLMAEFMKTRTEDEIYALWPFLETLRQEEHETEDRIASQLDRLESSFRDAGDPARINFE